MDALKKYVFYGKPLDTVNLMEECGDICWYLAIILHELGYTWAEVWKRNIEKLKARYGDKFTETRAEDRDLEKEREILEEKE
jgi:NTP pyrophosphatase (non-canonical NTP hydrolase)